VLYYDGMEAIIEGLKKTNGDLGNNEQAFQQALTAMQPTFPNGTVKLDQNRNSIQPAFVVQIVKNGSDLGFKVVQTVDSVDQTFGGLFDASSPAPSRDQPQATKGNPPPWGK
jgi:branched-chain amino acid transport system substrate-binding protein